MNLAASSQEVDDVYSFWQANQVTLSKLSIVALQILPAPATSSSCERDFSFAGAFTDPEKSIFRQKILMQKSCWLQQNPNSGS
jgi:hypothetical protein